MPLTTDKKPLLLSPTLLRPGPHRCQPGQPQGTSPDPISSPEELNEDPNLLQVPPSTDKPREKQFQPRPPRCQTNQPLETSSDPIGSPKRLNEDPNILQTPVSSDKPCKKPFYFPIALLRYVRPRPQPTSPDPIGSPKELSPPKELAPGVTDYDFSCGKIPTLPPDFNSREEIKRRLIAKHKDAFLPGNRCRGCGYLGHSSNWEGCPEHRCVLCGNRGHGKGFCPLAEPAQRWRERDSKTVREKARIKKMEKAKALQGMHRDQAIEQGRQPSEDQARETSREILSPRSLVKRRHRAADEVQARINEEEMRTPVAQMTAGFDEKEMIAPVAQMKVPFNEEGMCAPVAQMTAWMNEAERVSIVQRDNGEGMRAPAAQVTGPMDSSSQNAQKITSTTEGYWPYANVSISGQQPMVSWPSANIIAPEPQPLDDSRMDPQLEEIGVLSDPTVNQHEHSHHSGAIRDVGMNEEGMKAPVAQMTTASFDGSYATMGTPERWDWDIDTGKGTQHQETRAGTDTMIDEQGLSHDLGVEEYAEGDPYDQGQLFEPDEFGAASMEGTDNTRMGNQIQDTEAHADTAIEEQGYEHDLDNDPIGLDWGNLDELFSLPDLTDLI